MTTLDPTLELQLRLAESRAEDFTWGFNRLIEVIAEEANKHGPQVSEFMLKLVEASMERVSEEAQVRQALANASFNTDRETPVT